MELTREGQMAACWLEVQLGTTGYRLDALLASTPSSFHSYAVAQTHV